MHYDSWQAVCLLLTPDFGEKITIGCVPDSMYGAVGHTLVAPFLVPGQ